MFEYQAIAQSIFRSAYLVNIPEKERLPEMSEAAIYAVMTRIMLRRLVV
jgi:hypothetical protein